MPPRTEASETLHLRTYDRRDGYLHPLAEGYWDEDAWRQPQRMLREMFEFLNVDSGFEPDMSHRGLQRRGLGCAALAMDPSDRQYLIDYYREYVQKLSATLDRDQRLRRYLLVGVTPAGRASVLPRAAGA